MKTTQLNKKFRKVLARLLSLSMILAFILLSVVVKPSSDYKSSEIKKFEKAKKDYSESDFLLFEEDDERVDDDENGKEWLKDLSFDLCNRSLYISFATLNRNSDFTLFRQRHTITHTLPLFISIRAIKI